MLDDTIYDSSIDRTQECVSKAIKQSEMKILLVEDDPVQARIVQRALVPLGHDIELFTDGSRAVRWMKSDTPDLVVLDWQTPGLSGFEVLDWIRSHMGTELPVLFLTNRVLEVDIVSALEAGADDYMIKPFRVPILVARVSALLRRVSSDSGASNVLQAGNYQVFLSERSVLKSGQKVELTAKEYELVAFFFRNLGKIVSRSAIAKAAWGRELEHSSRTLDTHIYRIRQKLDLQPTNGVRLSAVHMHGYRMDLYDPKAYAKRDARDPAGV